MLPKHRRQWKSDEQNAIADGDYNRIKAGGECESIAGCEVAMVARGEVETHRQWPKVATALGVEFQNSGRGEQGFFFFFFLLDDLNLAMLSQSDRLDD